MPQHDYVIDNQSAPAARADINSVLQAIASVNSGATAPIVTYANMFWYDSTTKQLKKRNEGNSTWIIMGTVDDTGGTFTPNSLLTTAGIAPATLVTSGEGIAGNNNDSTLPTSAAVKAYADSIYPTATGAVGTYAFLIQSANTTASIGAGGTYAGSGLLYSGFNGGTSELAGGSPGGTWRAMGTAGSVTTLRRSTLFVRIS